MVKNNVNLQETFISVILVADKNINDLAKEVQVTAEILRSRYANYEIIIIDNQIGDIVIDGISVLLDEIPCIRIIRLSKPETRDVCIFVGLESAIGDITVIALLGQDPVELIPDFIEKAQKSDIVFGISSLRIRVGFINETGARLFYWYNKKYLGIDIPSNSTYFMALSRRVINAVTRTERYAKHIRYLARQIGYNSDELHYKPKSIKGDKKHIRALIISALELSTNYSKYPLRFVSWLGLAAALLNLFYAGYVVIINIVKKHVAEGWTTTSLQSSLMFFLLFLILAILSEYIGKILEESRNEPSYHIIEELNSKVSVADATRRNIIK